MSTRSSKRTVTSYSMSSSSAASGGGSSATNAADMSSPLSPHRISRLEEKEQLSGLNDRLAQYMDRVRQLEKENRQLSFQIKTQEETVTKERVNIREAYDAELADARRLLDEMAKDRARLQIEAGKLRAQVDELEARIGKLERDLKEADGRRLYAESQVQDIQAKLNSAENERKHFEDENMKIRIDVGDLRKQLESARKQLEEETLLRVDLENRLQSVREELAFEKQVHQQELEESRHKRNTEITQVNTQLEGEYEQKLQDGLRDMREQFEQQLRMSRSEFEEVYERKMNSIRDEADRKMNTVAGSRDELKKLKLQLESSMKDRDRFEGMVSDLEKRLRDAELELQSERDGFYSRLSSREEEIRRLKQEIAEMMQEYQDLLDTKIQLDVEIQAYRKLLEAEESRLHLTPGGDASNNSSGVKSTSTYSTRTSSSTATASPRGAKRKRIADSSSSRQEVSFSGLTGSQEEGRFTYKTAAHYEGAIEIQDHDTDGAFIKLCNVGDQDVSIGGWQLKRIAGEDEVVYKFHRAFILHAGKTATVWSPDAEVTHSPPADLVMRNQKWPTGEVIRSSLVNSDGEEIAWRESSRNSASSQRISYRSSAPDEADRRGYSSSTQRFSYRTSGAPDIGLEGANTGDGDDEQRCVIM